jgi:hypothetical protein
MNPAFEAACQPFLALKRYGIALITPDAKDIVAYWGPRADESSVTMTVHHGSYMRPIATHVKTMKQIEELGIDPGTVQYVMKLRDGDVQ